MADVRSLLRNERASRRINHPHASYTDSGKLLCSICVTQIKTESMWESHLKSTQHTIRLQQALDRPPQGKKRKASDAEDDGRKRAKGVPHAFFDKDTPELLPDSEDTTIHAQHHPSAGDHATSAPEAIQPAAPPAVAPAVDEEEWAAFERDLAALAPEPEPLTAINAAATISAAPLSAEDIAAQARDDQSLQRGKREAEIEAEREDAEQALQNEFDQMEELEDRLRRLREKREALRNPQGGSMGDHVELLPTAPAVETPFPASAQKGDDADEDESEDEDGEDFDDWQFGAR